MARLRIHRDGSVSFNASDPNLVFNADDPQLARGLNRHYALLMRKAEWLAAFEETNEKAAETLERKAAMLEELQNDVKRQRDRIQVDRQRVQAGLYAVAVFGALELLALLWIFAYGNSFLPNGR